MPSETEQHESTLTENPTLKKIFEDTRKAISSGETLLQWQPDRFDQFLSLCETDSYRINDADYVLTANEKLILAGIKLGTKSKLKAESLPSSEEHTNDLNLPVLTSLGRWIEKTGDFRKAEDSNFFKRVGIAVSWPLFKLFSFFKDNKYQLAAKIYRKTLSHDPRAITYLAQLIQQKKAKLTKEDCRQLGLGKEWKQLSKQKAFNQAMALLQVAVNQNDVAAMRLIAQAVKYKSEMASVIPESFGTRFRLSSDINYVSYCMRLFELVTANKYQLNEADCHALGHDKLWKELQRDDISAEQKTLHQQIALCQNAGKSGDLKAIAFLIDSIRKGIYQLTEACCKFFGFDGLWPELQKTGSKKIVLQCKALYQLAAKFGDANAMRILAEWVSHEKITMRDEELLALNHPYLSREIAESKTRRSPSRVPNSQRQSMQLLRAAAHMGSSKALLQLADILACGTEKAVDADMELAGIPKTKNVTAPQIAACLFSKACQSPDTSARARVHLARMIMQMGIDTINVSDIPLPLTKEEINDPKLAVTKLLREAAQQDDGLAYHELGRLIEIGELVPVFADQALIGSAGISAEHTAHDYYLAAAKKKIPDGMVKIAELIQNNKITLQVADLLAMGFSHEIAMSSTGWTNVEMAQALLLSAAHAGNGKAICLLGQQLEEDLWQAEPKLAQKINQIDWKPYSQANRYEQAKQFYLTAISKGESNAFIRLGKMIESKQVKLLEKDFKEFFHVTQDGMGAFSAEAQAAFCYKGAIARGAIEQGYSQLIRLTKTEVLDPQGKISVLYDNAAKAGCQFARDAFAQLKEERARELEQQIKTMSQLRSENNGQRVADQTVFQNAGLEALWGQYENKDNEERWNVIYLTLVNRQTLVVNLAANAEPTRSWLARRDANRHSFSSASSGSQLSGAEDSFASGDSGVDLRTSKIRRESESASDSGSSFNAGSAIYDPNASRLASRVQSEAIGSSPLAGFPSTPVASIPEGPTTSMTLHS